MTLKFLRNKVVEVEAKSNGALGVSWRLTDDLLKAEIELVVQAPDLEILEATATFSRFVPEDCRDAPALIEDIEGVNIGPGLRKIVHGLLGEGSILSHGVLECCNAVILHFTRPGIEFGESITDPAEKLAMTRSMVSSNPRLVKSCIAFQDGSPIMEGLNL
jgi:hypothetical protein